MEKITGECEQQPKHGAINCLTLHQSDANVELLAHVYADDTADALATAAATNKHIDDMWARGNGPRTAAPRS